MRVLIAPDKFKGSLTAAEAAAALAAGWREGWTGEPPEIETIPAADGGEGTAQALCDALGGRWVECPAHDCLGRPITARYVLADEAGGPLAVIETAEANGLWRVLPTERDLLRAETIGVGEMLRHAVETSGARRVILGIGGSATNDGGLGLAVALGWRFLDAGGAEITAPAQLSKLQRIVRPAATLEAEILVACDVANPLLGERGATQIYGPQKNLRGPEEAAWLEAGLAHLADVTAAATGQDYRELAGAGAAGGLGFGLLSFAGAELKPGFRLVADVLGLDAAVERADVVLTGEGSLDLQSLEGKVPIGVAGLARQHDRFVFAFAGRVAPEAREALEGHFDAVIELRALAASAEDSIARAAGLLRGSAARLAGEFNGLVESFARE